MTQLSSTSHAWLGGMVAALLKPLIYMWKVIKANSSIVLYLKLIFWFLTTAISFIPFIYAETKMFSSWGMTIGEMYAKPYEGILSVFVAMIAVAMFDMFTAIVGSMPLT
jgi:hypothetical protein